MLNPITKNINNLWESWNIRGVILFSLYLQIFLTMCSPLRKRMKTIFVQIFIWAAYLAADSTAIFCVSHIASSQVSSNKIKINPHNHLLAFWAPFLLVHLGGPDTITAFSLEDNQLWRRHMLGFVTQFIFCAYVFLLTVPGNRLWVPILLVFIAGMIKYGERIYAMYLAASIDECFSSPVTVGHGYCYFTGNDFHPNNDRDNLRVAELSLNLYYDKYFNKFLLPYGYLCRFVTMSCILTAFGLFLFSEKQGFDPFDVTITYTLSCAAVALDIVALLMQFFSERVLFISPKLAHLSFVKSILQLKRPRWSKCNKGPYTKFTQLSTWLPFRRWSESISCFNLISYSRYMSKPWLQYFNNNNIFSAIFLWLNEVNNPFLLELWVFIFIAVGRKEFDVRGRRKMWDRYLDNSLISETLKRELVPYLRYNNVLGEGVIVWHIATYLCYIDKIDNEVDEREFSKILSDYMMYLWVMQPDMISEKREIEIEQVIFKMKQYFINDEACKKFVAESTRDTHIHEILKKAGLLAKKLGMISEASVKWKIIASFWVESLSFAARECNSSIHLLHLSKGGELISLLRSVMEVLPSQNRSTFGIGIFDLLPYYGHT